MTRFKHLLFTILSIFSFQAVSAQVGWHWASENTFTFSSTQPLEDTWLSALGPQGSVYMVGTMGGETLSNILAGDITHCGAINVVDSGNFAQMMVARVDTAGNYLWVVSTQHSDVGAGAITADAEGNVYVVGLYDSFSCNIGNYVLTNPSYRTPNSDMYFMAKISPVGVVLWAQNIVFSIAGGVGDVTFPHGSINVDGAGNIYVGGEFYNNTVTIGATTLTNAVSFGPELFLAKFNSTGDAVWAKAFGQVANGGGFTYISSAITNNGNIFLSGIFSDSTISFGSYTLTSNTGYGMFIASLDSAGNTLWAKGATGNANDLLCGMAMDRWNNIYVTGGFNNATLSFGAYTITNTAAGSADVFIWKLNASGTELWAKDAGGTGDDVGFSVSTDALGEVWITGNSSGGFYSAGYLMVFGSDTSFTPPYSGGGANDPLWIVSYDTAGHFKNLMTVNSGGDNQCNILVDNMGGFYITGDWFEGTQVFGADTLNVNLYSDQTFVARYVYDTAFPVQVPHVDLPQPFTLYPNPASSQLTITSPAQITSIAISNIYGQSFTCPQNILNGGVENKAEISVGNLIPGTYLVKINNEAVQQWVKE